jgi:LysR family nitrogen assimilation transcriptional regulator
MDIKELRNFMHVARAGSVSRAAEELRLAQPALSRQIKKLEHEFGVALFARHGRGVRLSAAGSLLLERAEAITQLVHQTGEEIRDRRAPTGGRITVGAPPAAGRLLIPAFAERFQKAWPQTTLHMREGVSSSLQEWLLEKRIDIAILHNPPHLESFDIRPLLSERMLVIGPPTRRGERRRHLCVSASATSPICR